jgi:hypothetical protein
MFVKFPLKKDIYWATAVTFTALTVAILTNLSYLSSYALTKDDFSLVLHSTRFFQTSPLEWLTDGFRYYFSNYPELFDDISHFIRPPVNATLYIESLIANTPNSVVFLTTNYIGHSLCCGLVYLYTRLVMRLSVMNSLLAALLFLGTISAYPVLFSPAFRGDMLGALFGMNALLLTYVYVNYSRHFLVLSSILLLLTLSVFSKETAIVSPIIVVFYYLYAIFTKAKAPTSYFSLKKLRKTVIQSLPIILLIISPIFLYISVKISGSQGSVGAYPLKQFSSTTFLGLPVNVLYPIKVFTAFFFTLSGNPETSAFDVIKKILTAASTDFKLIRSFLALSLNLIGLSAVILLLRNKKYRPELIIFLILSVVAFTIPLLLDPAPRFLYFGQMFSLPLFVYAISSFFKSSHLQADLKRTVIVCTLAVSILINPFFFFATIAENQKTMVESNTLSTQLQNVFSKEIRNLNIHRVYLLNDVTGRFGSLSQLEMVASISNRNDLTLRVVNNLDNYDPNSSEKDEGVRVQSVNDNLLVSIQIGEEEKFDFMGANKAELDKLGVKGLINYHNVKSQLVRSLWGFQGYIVNQKEMTVSIPNASRKDYLLIGFDPGKPGVHILKPNDLKWQLAK